jgi:hypothetical protein
MMREQIGLIGLIIICFGCVDKGVEKPKIKSLTILTKNYPLWYSEDQAEEIENKDTLYLKYYEEFDSLGNLVVEKLRDGDIRQDTYYKNSYDASGTLVSRNWSPRNEFENRPADIFIYNTKRQLIKQIGLGRTGDTTSFYVYEYDQQGQRIAKSYLEPYGYSERYEYDGKKLVKEIGDFHKWIFIYNEQDQLAKQILFYDSQDTIASKSYVYNDLGKVAQMTHFDYQTKSSRIETFSYNSDGDIQEKIDDGKKLTYIYTYFK